jgi:hypothetical protein
MSKMVLSCQSSVCLEKPDRARAGGLSVPAWGATSHRPRLTCRSARLIRADVPQVRKCQSPRCQKPAHHGIEVVTPSTNVSKVTIVSTRGRQRRIVLRAPWESSKARDSFRRQSGHDSRRAHARWGVEARYAARWQAWHRPWSGRNQENLLRNHPVSSTTFSVWRLGGFPLVPRVGGLHGSKIHASYSHALTLLLRGGTCHPRGGPGCFRAVWANLRRFALPGISSGQR